MEPEHVSEDQESLLAATKSPLHTVTPLSKYLAMVLFILMPFIGGYIGYTYAPEKVVEVEKVVIKEVLVEVPVQAEQVSQGSVLFDNFELSQSEDNYVMYWTISDDVIDTFAASETAYITFNLVPEGEGIDYKNRNGVSQSIGDGFTLEKNEYSFDPRYYDDNFSWGLVWGTPYQVVAQVTYQPSVFDCDPSVKGECAPIFSGEDNRLVNEAKEYLFASESFILR